MNFDRERIVHPLPLPRSVKVESSQFCIYGVCLALNGGVALVESDGGAVSRYDLFGVYSMTFLDR